MLDHQLWSTAVLGAAEGKRTPQHPELSGCILWEIKWDLILTSYDPQAMKLSSTSSTKLLLWPRKTIHKSWTTGEKHLHKRYSYENDIMQVHRMEFCFLPMCSGNAALGTSAGLFCAAHLLESCLSHCFLPGIPTRMSQLPVLLETGSGQTDSRQTLVAVSFCFSMHMEPHWGSWAPGTAAEPLGRKSC